MKTIEINVQMGLVGCVRTSTFEVEDETPDDEIEAMAQEELHELISWSWRALGKDEKPKKRLRVTR